MINAVSQKILKILIRNNAVRKEQESLVLFGIEQGLHLLINVFIMIMTGFLLGRLWQSIIMLISFMSVRRYAGGYHADTRMQCAVMSWIVFFITITVQKYVFINFMAEVTILAVTLLILYCFCPVQNHNKLLADREIKKYRFTAFRNFLICICVFVLGIIIKNKDISVSIVLGMAMVDVIILLDKVKFKR